MDQRIVSIYAIGGSDCTGGAGIQADIKAASILGVNCLTALTAVTAQNSFGIKKIRVVDRCLLQSQLECMKEETKPDGVKIGMVGSIENLKVISDFIDSLENSIPIVIDPIISSSAGGLLIEEALEGDTSELEVLYKKLLFPKATVITPNIEEAFNLLKKVRKETLSNDIIGSILPLLGCQAVVVKGGHGNGSEVRDCLAFKNSGGETFFMEKFSKKIDCNNLHGTGCVYSSLLASFLAIGFGIPEAFLQTSELMNRLIERSVDYKISANSYGPLNLINFKKYSKKPQPIGEIS